MLAEEIEIMNKRTVQIEYINRRAKEDALGFVAECEKTYLNKILPVADKVAADNGKTKVILLSGPSSSGKTTTSKIFIEGLKTRGIEAVTVSTDDFFVDRDKTPRNADGTFDFENVKATDMELLKHCLFSLLADGEAIFPVYEFCTGTSKRYGKKVKLPKNGLVIVEGIHALNPILTADERLADALKLYVCVFTNFVCKDRVLTAQELRLTRRILRDCLTRGTSPAKSIAMWRGVLKGEDLYIKPYISDADFVIDTTHDYEPLVYRDLILPKLKDVFSEIPANMFEDYRLFDVLPPEIIPPDSLLNEFVIRQ